MVNRFLSRFQRRVIIPDCPDGQTAPPLMTRYALWRSRKKVTFEGVKSSKYALFLHNFHRSDLDDFHDHPWAFITFLFNSGYWEHTPVYVRGRLIGKHRTWKRRFSVLYRPATFQHYIEIPKPLWTLVFRFPETRRWGFVINGQWMFWRQAEDLQSRSICEDKET